MSDFVLLKKCDSRMQAEIEKGLLESSGIPCIVQCDDCGGQRLQMNFAEGIRLLVRQKDLKEARALLNEPCP